MQRLGLLFVLIITGVACGEDNTPGPGHLDPCLSPLASALQCPPALRPPQTGRSDEAEACAKLVSCGVLAADLLDSNDNHRLDFRWCVGRLENPGIISDPCNQGRRYSVQEAQTTASCILELPCESVGLPLGDKLGSSSQRPELDQLICADSSTRWTATVCDGGLLRY